MSTHTETVHLCPPPDTMLMPCCSRTPFKVPATDRLTIHEDQVTCPGTPEGDLRKQLAKAWFDGYEKGNLDGYFGTTEERAKSPYIDLDPYREDQTP